MGKCECVGVWGINLIYSLLLHFIEREDIQPCFTADDEALFACRYENGYDLTNNSRYNQAS